MARESARRRGRKPAGPRELQQLPWRRIDNPYAPIEVLSEEGLLAITETAYRILEEIGMDFLHPAALEILKNAGAEVESGVRRANAAAARNVQYRGATGLQYHLRGEIVPR